MKLEKIFACHGSLTPLIDDNGGNDEDEEGDDNEDDDDDDDCRGPFEGDDVNENLFFVL